MEAEIVTGTTSLCGFQLNLEGWLNGGASQRYLAQPAPVAAQWAGESAKCAPNDV
jgi:hypothetical protein